MLATIPAYAKAVVAALIAGLGSAQQALDDGAITAQEWVAVAVAALIGLGVVAAVPNREPAAEDDGHADLGTVLVAAAVTIVVLAVYVVFVR